MATIKCKPSRVATSLMMQQSTTTDADNSIALDCNECSPISPMLFDPISPVSDLKMDDDYICIPHDEDKSDEALPGLTFLQMMMQTEDMTEDILLAERGYKKLYKLSDITQGELFKAKMTKSGEIVAIKKVCKILTEQQICKSDGMTHCVSKNVRREAQILKHLTVDNTANRNYLLQYIDFFESEDDFYFVTKYIDGMTLKQFIETAHSYLKCGKLKLKNYHKAIKYILWQLLCSVRLLHDVYHCCHLDLCLENILLEGVRFERNACAESILDFIHISLKDLSIKLSDFGVAEIFNINDKNGNYFKCNKQGLTVDNQGYQAPNVFNEYEYDARAADMWSLGMIFYQCMTGRRLYEPIERLTKVKHSGFYALEKGQLKEYLHRIRTLQFFTKNGVELLCQLLDVNESKRISAMNCMRSDYFKRYYKVNKEKIDKKLMKHTRRLQKQYKKMGKFPFYSL